MHVKIQGSSYLRLFFPSFFFCLVFRHSCFHFPLFLSSTSCFLCVCFCHSEELDDETRDRLTPLLWGETVHWAWILSYYGLLPSHVALQHHDLVHRDATEVAIRGWALPRINIAAVIGRYVREFDAFWPTTPMSAAQKRLVCRVGVVAR
jgi:hypothetical protein